MGAFEVGRFTAHILLLIFNCSVVIFIYRMRQSDAKLRSGFYLLFLAITVSECIEVLTVSEWLLFVDAMFHFLAATSAQPNAEPLQHRRLIHGRRAMPPERSQRLVHDLPRPGPYSCGVQPLQLLLFPRSAQPYVDGKAPSMVAIWVSNGSGFCHVVQLRVTVHVLRRWWEYSGRPGGRQDGAVGKEARKRTV